jgi:hypothetical protein
MQSFCILTGLREEVMISLRATPGPLGSGSGRFSGRFLHEDFTRKNRVSARICWGMFVSVLASSATAQQNAVVTAVAPSNPVPGRVTFKGVLKDSGGQSGTTVLRPARPFAGTASQPGK